MKYTLLAILLLSSLSANVFAQQSNESVTIVKTKADKKTVNVDVQMTDKDHRDVKITINEDGKEKIIQWQDDGTIPADIKHQLEAENIDVQMLTQEDDEQMTITVDAPKSIQKEMIIIKKRDDGDDDSQMYEWNGEGEMPSKMKELLEEHDIEISGLGHDSKKLKKNLEESKEVRKKMRIKAMKNGRDHNIKTESHYKIISVDDNGQKKVVEWDGNGDTPEGMEDIHQEVEIIVDDSDGEEPNIFMFKSKEDIKLSDAYMGAHISSEGGAKIIEIQKNSPADNSNLKINDVIKRVNGARVKNMDNLLDLLNYYEPNDELELTVERKGGEKKIKLTLGTRPKQFRL